MDVVTEDAAEIVRANFRRLAPAERRDVLRQLITDLDVPQQDGARADGESETKSESSATSGRLLEWFEEIAPQTELEIILREYLPDFDSSVLTDPRQRVLINQRLSGLGLNVLYELHQKVMRSGKRIPRPSPEEIINKTWGTIRGIDPEILREIIEDEDYCGY
ncbi:MAG: hypothetical protein ACREA2_17005 [Blastocatellia bacterium]